MHTSSWHYRYPHLWDPNRKLRHQFWINDFVTDLAQDILRVLSFWKDIPWEKFTLKREVQIKQDYKGVDLKYAFDAESTHAQPYRPWRAPATFKPDGL